MSLPKTLSMNVIKQLNAPPETTALQKALIIFSMGVFIALASLTASLPLNLPSRQPNSLPGQADAYSTATPIVVGDTMWAIVATVFGILLTPAFTYLYANYFGRTSSFSIQVIAIAASMITTVWIVLSFSLIYAKDANGDQILGFPKYHYMFANVGASPNPDYAPTIPFSIFAVFELSFALLSASIVVSSLIDRVNVYGLLFFLFVWHICIYAPMAHIVWHPRGFFKTNDIEDFSGGIVVHMTAGVTIVAAHLFLDWIKAPPAEQRQPNNPEGILFSAFLVWFLWFGINAGKAYGASFVASQSIVNTIAAVFTSVLLNYFFDQVASVPVTNISLVNGILLGLISTSPSSGYVTVGGSMVVTVITVIVTRFFGKVIRKEALNDNAYSLATLHGVGGSVSFLFTALISYNFINPSGALNGLTYGVDTPIRNHTAAILAVWSCGFLAVLLALFLSNLVVPISKTAQPKGEFYPTALGPLGHGNNDSADYNSTANYNVDAPQENQEETQEDPAQA